MLRIARVTAVSLAALALVLLLVFLVLRSSVAQTRGLIEIPAPVAGHAVDGELRIVRDADGVPHIEAGSRTDAVFGLGFVHAQDRLWQMEFQRRVGSGTLAAAVGPGGLATDRFIRTLGVRQASEASLAALTDDDRRLLDAYVGGINAYLATRTGVLPPEFLILGVRPEPWVPADVIVWQKMMAWDLTGGEMNDEILRARLIADLGAERASELFPPYPGDAPVILADRGELYRQVGWEAFGHALPEVHPENGSNAWALAASKTLTARPLLANDPHLGLQAPSLWYFAHLKAPDFEVIGATLPGTPAVLLGHNGRIAWGFTNAGSDVLDLYVERIDPEDPQRYRTPDGSEPFEVRREVIEVKGGSDEVLEVRSTRHGPVIDDVVGRANDLSGTGHVIALRWTALDPDDTTIGAAMDLGAATSWESFVATLERWVVPQQVMVYADVDGNIGLIAPSRIPIRSAADGKAPVPGWTGEGDWLRSIPFEELPRSFNPDDGILVSANHKLVDDAYPYDLTDEWTAPYRAERIATLLADTAKHGLESFAEIQADTHSLHAGRFVALARRAEPSTPLARDALQVLMGWDGSMSADAPAPLLFSAWYRALVREVLEDDLGPLFPSYAGFRPLFMESVLDGDSAWCDDVRTTRIEDCVLVAGRALDVAAAELAEAHGSDVSAWTWGAAHRVAFEHAVMGGTPFARVFEMRAVNDGGPFTVDVASYPFLGSFVQDHGPGFRGLYDLSDLDRSLYIHGTGQSGNPLSTRYRDLFDRWIDNRYLSMDTRTETYAAGNAEVLTLRPRR